MVGLPRAIIKKYGVSKAAWRAWRAQRKVKRTVRGIKRLEKRGAGMSRRSKKIAIAPIAGMIAGLAMWLSYVKKGYDAYGWDGAKFNALSSMTGFTYNGETGAYEGWKMDELSKGLVPVIAFSLAGWGVHKLATKMGINRNLPVISL